jgi:ribonuclease HII
MRYPPSFNRENELAAQGYRKIAGVDEVGRGAIAGPVAAASIILPPDFDAPWLPLVRESKELTPRKRELLFQPIREAAVAMGVGMVSSKMVDTHGIVAATKLAMQIAVSRLSPEPDFLLIDALTLPLLNFLQENIIHGDKLSLSIACASIVAKVSRDHLMAGFDAIYPGYGFAQHKGYGTREHFLSLQCHGPSPIHRRSFASIGEMPYHNPNPWEGK